MFKRTLEKILDKAYPRHLKVANLLRKRNAEVAKQLTKLNKIDNPSEEDVRIRLYLTREASFLRSTRKRLLVFMKEELLK